MEARYYTHRISSNLSSNGKLKKLKGKERVDTAEVEATGSSTRLIADFSDNDDDSCMLTTDENDKANTGRVSWKYKIKKATRFLSPGSDWSAVSSRSVSPAISDEEREMGLPVKKQALANTSVQLGSDAKDDTPKVRITSIWLSHISFAATLWY